MDECKPLGHGADHWHGLHVRPLRRPRLAPRTAVQGRAVHSFSSLQRELTLQQSADFKASIRAARQNKVANMGIGGRQQDIVPFLAQLTLFCS